MNRVEKAEELHKQGFNCAQAVAMAFADLYNIDQDQMARQTCAFGGGIAKQQLTCGAVLAMCMLMGLEEGNSNSEDKEKRSRCYAETKRLCSLFREKYGSTECKDIIGKNPCGEKVMLAAELFDNYLKEKNN